MSWEKHWNLNHSGDFFETLTLGYYLLHYATSVGPNQRSKGNTCTLNEGRWTIIHWTVLIMCSLSNVFFDTGFFKLLPLPFLPKVKRIEELF